MLVIIEKGPNTLALFYYNKSIDHHFLGVKLFVNSGVG